MTPIRMTQATAFVLRALATGHRHGFEIMEVTGLASGTVYPVLRRLEGERAVTSTWEDEAEARSAGRPRRRVYDLTGHGERLAEMAAERLRGAMRFLADEGLAGA
jgi:DNA-binding PadR family transcriptional regulator